MIKSLKAKLCGGASRRYGAVIPQTQRHRRDAYATFRSPQATSGTERSRAHCIIGVPPVFPICAKGDDQKLESQTLWRSQSQMPSCHSTNTAAQARRLCYFSFGFRHPGGSKKAEKSCPPAKVVASVAFHRTTVETIKTLAGMVRFVIVDLTDDYGPHRTPIFGRPSIHVAGAHPKGRRLRPGDVGPYVVAFMAQGPIERRSLLALICKPKE
jgi:hypothetical protein